MYEAEIKLAVHDAQSVREYFDARAPGELEEYADTYLQHHLLVPPGSDRELRVREVRSANGVQSILTFKDQVVDVETQSKREREVEVANAADTVEILLAIGFEPDILFRKHCVNWRLQEAGRLVLVSLVEVPELSGHFLELEAVVDNAEDVDPAIGRLRQLAHRAGLSRGDETVATYTEAVRSARQETP